MKTSVFIILLVFCISCKQEKKEVGKLKPLTIAEKIANAHGFENWKNVSKIEFSFNVDKDSAHSERTWTWEPKTNSVIFHVGKDSIVAYNRKKLDSTAIKLDKGFVNDKFWLLVPFQLMWDKSAIISEPIISEAPISKAQMNKITLTYPNEGGYTPGDAYDLFYGNDYLIKEWIFRRGNSKEPSLTNTFENYQDFNGLKLALKHRKVEGNWNLNFTNIKVTLE